MSDTGPTATDRPQSGSQPALNGAAKKMRSPVERAIVWGLILILLIVLLIDGRASLGFRSSYARLQEKLDEAEKSDSPVTELEVKALVSGYSGEPAVNEQLEPNLFNAKREDVYAFSGLIKTSKLYVYYGVKMPDKEREVIRVSLEKVGPLPFEDFNLPPPNVQMGPPGMYNEGAEESATATGDPATQPTPEGTTGETPTAEPAADGQ